MTDLTGQTVITTSVLISEPETRQIQGKEINTKLINTITKNHFKFRVVGGY
jgi:hypothetical protein